MSNAKTDHYIRCSHCQNSMRPIWTSKAVHCPSCDNLIEFTRYNVRWPTSTDSKCLIMEKFQSKFKCQNSSTSSSNTSSQNTKLIHANGITSVSKERPRKRAVLCGVSYKKKKYELKGTVNDVNNMTDLLIQDFGFQQESIRVLTEDEKDEDRKPTRRNITNALEWLVKDCKLGDSLVFFFSGHGLRQPEKDPGDEADGFDESICPVDFVQEGVILDNDINHTIVHPLPGGVTLHAIVDACHSGTVLDLPYLYDIQKEEWLEPQTGVHKGTSGGLAICLSACADDELAADTSALSKKNMTGAMTMSLIQAIRRMPRLTYRELLRLMKEVIEEANKSNCLNKPIFARFFQAKLLQETVLSSSEKFNIDKRFQL